MKNCECKLPKEGFRFDCVQKFSQWPGILGLVDTGTERWRTNFVLCSDGNAIVPLTCSPFASSYGNGTERLRIVPLSVSLFNRSIFWNGTVLFKAFPSERNPSAFHSSE